jgi:hypothetical protein
MSGHRDKRCEQGQVIALFALIFTLLVVMVGLVIDGGYAFAMRREAQNAADFASLAGARIVAERIGGDTLNGTDANVVAAIQSAVTANNAATVTFGGSEGPRYVDVNGNVLDHVGEGVIPATAVGVRVNATRSWRTFFIGIAGFSNWSATATATARGGYFAGDPGGIFPAGIAEAFFNNRQTCSGPLSGDVNSPCHPQQFSPGDLNVPGGFGWLKLGCDGYGLGQDPPESSGGCRTNEGFLQEEIDGNSFGCCTRVGLPGSLDRIGSLPGNKTAADCTALINGGKMVNIAVWDVAGGTGSNAWYHIVGYTGFQITDCDGGKHLSGVWRQPFFLGPTTTTPGFAGQGLAVELVR